MVASGLCGKGLELQSYGRLVFNMGDRAGFGALCLSIKL